VTDCTSQKVKDSKEEMLELAAHASGVTSELFAGLQSLDDVDNLIPIIDDYVK
jgi:hypothetical protein